VETRTETKTRTERFSVKLPDDLETDIPCTATGLDQFMAALFVRVRNRLQLPPGYQAVMPGRPSVATVKVVIEVPASGEPLGATLGSSSGVEPLDRAVLAALDKTRCMPPPPAKLVDSKTRSFRINQAYGFERTN
jgi:TonB family protein